MRVKATLSYDGSKFNGFQLQKHELRDKKSVVGFLTKELSELNIHTTIVGSGRTDAGVHALHQVLHFDIPSFWTDTQKLKSSINERIKPYAYFQDIRLISDTFHARYHAQKRLYRYVLYTGSYQPILANYALHVEDINIDLMHQAVQVFVGKHDFGFFKKSDGATTGDLRNIFKAEVYRYKNFVIINFLGDAFLRSQIRLMCGFLLKISSQQFSIDDLKNQLAKKERVCTAIAPACGLYLSRIYY